MSCLHVYLLFVCLHAGSAYHHWSFDKAETMFDIKDETTNTFAILKGSGASFTSIGTTNQQKNNYLTLSGDGVALNLGILDDCIGNIVTCKNGLVLSLWLRFQTTSSEQHIIGSSSWRLRVKGTLMNFLIQYKNYRISKWYKCKPGLWSHHTFVWDGETLSAYLNANKVKFIRPPAVNVMKAIALGRQTPLILGSANFTIHSDYDEIYIWTTLRHQKTIRQKYTSYLDDIVITSSCNVTSSSICVEWLNPEDYYELIQAEYLEYGIQNIDIVQRISIGIYQNQKCLTNLEPISSYSIKAFIILKNGETRSSNTIMCKTSDGVPESPSRLHLRVNDSTTLRATWRKPRPPKGNILSYEVALIKVSSQNKEVLRRNISSTADLVSLTLRKLAPGTKYMVKISSVGRLGRSTSKSNVVRTYVEPKDSSAVDNFLVSRSTENSIHLKWDFVVSPLTSPHVSYRVFYRMENQSRRHIDTKRNAVVLRNLKPTTAYYINIRVFTSSKEGRLRKKDLLVITDSRNECLHPRENSCGAMASCIDTKEFYVCRCLKNYYGDGKLCRRVPHSVQHNEAYFCKEQEFRNIKWPRTYSGGEAVVGCPQGVSGFATRKCLPATKSSHAVYDSPDLSGCISKEMEKIQVLVRDERVSGREALTKLDEVTKMISLYGGDIKQAMEYANFILSYKLSKETSGIQICSEKMTSFVSNMLSNSSMFGWHDIPQIDRSKTANEVIELVEDVSKLAANKLNKSFQIDQDNIVLKVEIDSKEPSLNIKERSKTGYQIQLPTEDLFALGLSSTPIIFAKYDNIGPFLSSPPNGKSVSNSVISASIVGKTVSFKSPVIIKVPHPVGYIVSSPSCVFWNEATSTNGVGWSTNGCVVNKSVADHTVCHCYHLTSFAVLMTLTETATDSLLDSGHEFALKLITYIGLGISIAALSIAFITFSCFRFLKSTRTIYHRYLVLSLLMASIIFVAGIESTQNKILCQVVAVFLEYFYLVSFLWMGVEGILLYFMLRKVFKDPKFFKRKLFHATCWVAPGIYIGAFCIAYPDYYGTENYCWLSIEDGFIISFIVPVLLVIVFNIFVTVLAFRIMAKKYRDKHDQIARQIWYWVKGCFVLMFLLGVTWLFGLLHVNSSSIVFAYVFSILNALQGLFIFIFHCLIDTSVRDEYLRLLKCQPRSEYNEKAGYSSSMRYRKMSSSLTNASSDKKKMNVSASDNSYKNDSLTERYSPKHTGDFDERPLLQRRITFEESTVDDVFEASSSYEMEECVESEVLKACEEYRPPPYSTTSNDESRMQIVAHQKQEKQKRLSDFCEEVILNPVEFSCPWRLSLFDNMEEEQTTECIEGSRQAVAVDVNAEKGVNVLEEEKQMLLINEQQRNEEEWEVEREEKESDDEEVSIMEMRRNDFFMDDLFQNLETVDQNTGVRKETDLEIEILLKSLELNTPREFDGDIHNSSKVYDESIAASPDNTEIKGEIAETINSFDANTRNLILNESEPKSIDNSREEVNDCHIQDSSLSETWLEEENENENHQQSAQRSPIAENGMNLGEISNENSSFSLTKRPFYVNEKMLLTMQLNQPLNETIDNLDATHTNLESVPESQEESHIIDENISKLPLPLESPMHEKATTNSCLTLTNEPSSLKGENERQRMESLADLKTPPISDHLYQDGEIASLESHTRSSPQGINKQIIINSDEPEEHSINNKKDSCVSSEDQPDIVKAQEVYIDTDKEITEALHSSASILDNIVSESDAENENELVTNGDGSIQDHSEFDETIQKMHITIKHEVWNGFEEHPDNRMSLPSTIIHEINDLIAAIPPKMEATSPKPRKRIRSNKRLQSQEEIPVSSTNEPTGVEDLTNDEDVTVSLTSENEEKPTINAEDIFRFVDQEIEKDQEKCMRKSESSIDASSPPVSSIDASSPPVSPTFRSQMQIIQLKPGHSLIGKQEDLILDMSS